MYNSTQHSDVEEFLSINIGRQPHIESIVTGVSDIEQTAGCLIDDEQWKPYVSCEVKYLKGLLSAVEDTLTEDNDSTLDVMDRVCRFVSSF